METPITIARFLRFLFGFLVAGCLAHPNAFAYYNLFAFYTSGNIPAKLAFSPANPTLPTWSCTAESVVREGNTNMPASEGTTIVSLSGTNVSFFSDSGCSNPISMVTILPGSSSVVVYFSYSATGSQSITASSVPLIPATQTTTVTTNPYTWIGGASCDQNWSTGACWFGGSAPASYSSESAHFDSTCTLNCSSNINGGLGLTGIYLHPGYSALGIVTVLTTNPVTLGLLSVEAGSFVASSGDLALWTILQTGGSLTISSGNTYVGNVTVSGGVFHHNSGTMLLVNGGQAIINAPSISLSNLYIRNQYTPHAVIIVGGLSIAGNLTINSAYAADLLVSGTIYVQGNLIAEASWYSGWDGSATIVMNGSGTQIIDGGDGTTQFPCVTIASTGTVQLKNTVGVVQWNWQSGVIDASTYANTFSVGSGSGPMTFTPGVFTYPNANWLRYYVYGSDTITGTWYVENVTFSGIASLPTLNGGSLNITGNVNFNDNFSSAGTTTINLVGTGLQAISSTGGSISVPMVINKPSGTAQLTTSFANWSYGVTVMAGNFDLNGNSIGLAGALTIQSGASLTLQGSESVGGSPNTFNSGSTVIYDGTGNYTSGDLDLGDTYSNLTFNGSGGQWEFTNALTVAGNFSLTAGTVTAGNSLSVGGNWANTGTFTSGTNTVTFTPSSNHSISGSTSFYNLTIDNSAGTTPATITFAAGSTQTILNSSPTALILKGASANILSLVSSSPGSQWNIAPTYTIGASGPTVGTYLSVTDSNDTGGGGTKPLHSGTHQTNGGNNTNWSFP